MESQKKLETLLKKNTCNNRYDLYRLKASMDEYIQFLFEEELKVSVDNRFSNWNILGGLICLIAMAYSHFNPYDWPDNYYIVLVCVVVYYLVLNAMLLYQYFYEKGAFILFKFNKPPKQLNSLKGILIRVSSKVWNYKNKYLLTIANYNDLKQSYCEELKFNHFVNEEGVLEHKILKNKLYECLDKFQSTVHKKKH